MKDRLEEYVRGHSHEFDMLEPDDALWVKIEKKLDKGKKIRLSYYLSRAAVVAAIFALSFMVQQYFFREKNRMPEIPELKEAEMYYSGLIDTKLKEIKPYLTEYPDIEKEMDADMSQLDSVYTGLKNDLKDNVSNQEVIEAMIQNYRMRIEILEQMQQYLDKDSDDKTNKNNPEYEF
jgi:hypothetical protein